MTLTDEDFEKAKGKKEKVIQILHFTDLQSIRPIYFEKTYHAVPEAGGDRAYELLRRCMLDGRTAAIAKGVIGQSEHLMALIPTETGILAETLFFQDEVKALPKEPVRAELTEQELSMGKTIIGSMKEAFDPSKYHDEYRERLWEIIQAKANHQEITVAPDEQPCTCTVLDVAAVRRCFSAAFRTLDACTAGRTRVKQSHASQTPAAASSRGSSSFVPCRKAITAISTPARMGMPAQRAMFFFISVATFLFLETKKRPDTLSRRRDMEYQASSFCRKRFRRGS